MSGALVQPAASNEYASLYNDGIILIWGSVLEPRVHVGGCLLASGSCPRLYGQRPAPSGGCWCGGRVFLDLRDGRMERA
jgi:hypothetical protein